MEKILYKYGLWVLLGATACNDFLEIEPQEEIPTELALTKSGIVEGTLISAYADLNSDDFLGERVKLYSELSSENYNFDAVTIDLTDFEGQVISRTTNSFNKDVSSLWINGYSAIAKSNNVLGALADNLIEDKVLTEEEKNSWQGEALFIRAVAHFEIVRLFAKPFSARPDSDLGIPIRIKSLVEDEKIPRSTVAAVYDRVIMDLKAAAVLLPANNGNRATSWAAKAYLARVYFNQLNYGEAFSTAQDIIDNSGFNLEGNALTAFKNRGNTPPEGGVILQAINESGFNSKFAASGNNTYPLSSGTGSISELITSDPNDFRATLVTTNARGNQFTTKWDDGGVNIPLIRFAEILLIHAESSLLKASADLDAARSSFDMVRGFSVTPYSPTSLAGDDLIGAIRDERRIELIGEGERYHDLKRLMSDDIRGLPYDDEGLLLTIPLEETSGNQDLNQNG